MAVAVVLLSALLVGLTDAVYWAQTEVLPGDFGLMLIRDVALVLLLSAMLVVVLDRLVLQPLRRLAASTEAFDLTLPPPLTETELLQAPTELRQISHAISRVHTSLWQQLQDEQQRGLAMRASLLETEHQLEGKLRELGSLSRVDRLTGLPNRREFDEALRREFKRALRHRGALALAVLDLDHFKAFNARFGESIGDAALLRFARLLSARFKRDTDLVARLGGEEFVALLPGCGIVEAQGLLEQVHEEWRESVALDGAPLTASIGLAGFGTAQPYLSPQALLQAADEALAIAKHSGRDRLSLAASALPA